MPDPDADLLGVRADAPLADLKKAFRRAALAHHPDQNPHPEAARHFRRLTEAYRALEARAVRKEPPRAKPPRRPEDKLGFLLGDLKALLNRWPAERWSRPVEGLPAGVWALGALQAVADAWPGVPRPVGPPTPETLDTLIAHWADLPSRFPLPSPLAVETSRRLGKALDAAEGRIRTLERPVRARS